VVEEDVAFGPENLGIERSEIRERVDGALSIVGLTGLERREPHLLSGGQKQRLAIAGALAMRPAYLVLDEPTAMLDPEGRGSVLALVELLKSQGVGILFITHHLADVVTAERVVVLDAGRIAFAGTPAELLATEGVLESCGLESPPLQVMEAALRETGFRLPAGPLSAEGMAEALCS
jgi:energy-coupling factor transport system ATP-binding protein